MMLSGRTCNHAFSTRQMSHQRGALALRSARSEPAQKTASSANNGDAAPSEARTVPSERALAIWRSADAVCFDVDCTITINDGLDLLAEFMGVKEEVEELTNKAMDGTMSLTRSLEERLNLINCSPDDIRRFIKAYPPQSRLAPGIKELIKALQKRGVAVYLISGGFRELLLPIAAHLGIPKDRVFANRMHWQWDDETGMPTKLVGFDTSEPTARNQGKPEAIARIRENNPYNTVVMIGDGITDLEAVQTSGGADLFIGSGVVVEREAVVAEAEWYVYDYKALVSALSRYKVAMVGSGAWACAAVRMIAQNTSQDDPEDEFDDDVRMWVHQGGELVDTINSTHENPAYFPGIPLGPNVIATGNLAEAVADADLLVFCAPHQYIRGICKQLMGKVKPGAAAISLTKGMRVTPEGPELISQIVRRTLGVDCSVLMGGNIAEDVGREQLSEAVIGYYNLEHAQRFKKLFQRPYFRVTLLPDPVGAELCGTLKNIVALGVGMVDGLGMGPNSKAAIIRQGLLEMRDFCQALYPSVRDDTFLECCGVGDLVATCIGGRNRRVAEAWTRSAVEGAEAGEGNGAGRSWAELEKELLQGQKLQGVLTSNEVQQILRTRGWESKYPLFTTINRIVNGHLPPHLVVDYLEGAKADIAVDVEEDIVPLPRQPASAMARLFGQLVGGITQQGGAAAGAAASAAAGAASGAASNSV
eukprot:XP_001689796.1 predicted protein [Chlamydomonas reinhardtii]